MHGQLARNILASQPEPAGLPAYRAEGASQMPVTDTNFNPSGDATIHAIKSKANELAELIEALPAGRRRSIAITNLEQASMWGVKAAACGDD